MSSDVMKIKLDNTILRLVLNLPPYSLFPIYHIHYIWASSIQE